MTSLKLPAAHKKHDVIDALGAYFPVGQPRHALAPRPDEYFPASHALHAVTESAVE